MNLVRQELGHDAVVVESKEVQTRRLLPWPATRQEVQISAEKNRLPSQKPRRPANTAKPARTIRTLAEASQRTVTDSPLLKPLQEVHPGLAAISLDDDSNSVIVNTPPATAAAATTDVQSSSAVDRVQPTNELTTVEMLQQAISRMQLESRTDELPADCAVYFQRLVERGVTEAIARELVTKVRQYLNTDELRSSEKATATLMALAERELRCAPPIMHKSGRREIVMMVGPTGVGKTTTVAKLASRFRLHEGLRVGLVTIDTYRVGAIEQLQTFADILQIPMEIASNADELRRAIDRMDNVDIVLIDTAGRSPFDSQKMIQLRELVDVARPDHVMLTLSLGSGGATNSKIAKQFSLVSPTSLVITKVDECDGCGGLLTIARDVPCPVRYITTGQDVPDHIEPSHPQRLARLIFDT